MSGEELHVHLDEIEHIHGLYSPVALGLAAALACGAFTFLLGGGPFEMICAFLGEYKTEERAKKVLQDIIGFYIRTEEKNKVYRMPKE